ncbi:ABC transporter substrate-binding protein [Dactylosporangium sp. CA-233914]|uniref:ABC transporter substrate-binding protein n=1 Tax=Dactylosporangium sp. CA-233914 TaxID=3239934 RepID=UPI003D9146D7
MVNKRTALYGLATAIAISGLTGCGSSNGSGGTDSVDGTATVTVIYTDNANTAAFTLGVEKGIFSRHRIDIKALRPASSAGSDQVPLLLNGQAQVGITDVTAVPSAVAKGFGVQIVTSLVADYESPTSSTFAAMVPQTSGIESFKDLEGKTVGVAGLNTHWSLQVMESVRKAGGDPTKVKLLAVPLPNQVATLQQGKVDAVNTLQPFIGQLQQAGFKSLGDPAAIALGPHSIVSVLMASKQYTKEHSAVMSRFLDAWAEAEAYANSHPDEVRAQIVAKTGTPAEVVRNLPLPWYASGVSRDSTTKIMELMVRYGSLDKSLPIDDVVWSTAPNADLSTPPPGITVKP